jgi:hypothetical protein
MGIRKRTKVQEGREEGGRRKREREEGRKKERKEIKEGRKRDSGCSSC